MSSFTIKILAVLFMLIDHIGLIYFPEHFILRMIGRLSAPLFFWLIASGAHHTKDLRNYIVRIALFAVLSQVPYYLVMKEYNLQIAPLNILFTLGTGLCAIAILKRNALLGYAAGIVFATVATLLQMDYGAYGILTIVSFYLFYRNKLHTALGFVAVVLFFLLFDVFEQLVIAQQDTISLQYNNALGLLALVFIVTANGKPGPRMKYLFYAVYPLQYVVFYLISYFR